MHCTKCRCSKNRSKPAYGPNLTKARFVLWRVDVIHGHKAWTCDNCNNQKIAAMQNIWYTKHAMVKGIHFFASIPTIANHQNPTSHNLQTKMRQWTPASKGSSPWGHQVISGIHQKQYNRMNQITSTKLPETPGDPLSEYKTWSWSDIT